MKILAVATTGSPWPDVGFSRPRQPAWRTLCAKLARVSKSLDLRPPNPGGPDASPRLSLGPPSTPAGIP